MFVITDDKMFMTFLTRWLFNVLLFVFLVIQFFKGVIIFILVKCCFFMYLMCFIISRRDPSENIKVKLNSTFSHFNDR